uniref:Uncharacterized protein n=1 Tax=Maylandia zebra TaxID=106582 RepID=A0A3P9CU47_9CICH
MACWVINGEMNPSTPNSHALIFKATYKLTFLSVSFCLTAYSIPEISPYKKMKSNFRILADSKIYTRQPSSPHHRNLLTQHTIRHRFSTNVQPPPVAYTSTNNTEKEQHQPQV